MGIKVVDPLNEANRPRVIICGTCDDQPFVFRKLDKLLSKLKNPIICLQGRARGLDKIVNLWAFKQGHLRKIFYPDNERHGRAKAAEKAVSEMVKYAAERKPSFVLIFGEDERMKDETWSVSDVLVVRHIEVNS